jgi:hypothetical protein
MRMGLQRVGKRVGASIAGAVVLIAAALAPLVGVAQTPSPRPFRIVKNDAALDGIVSPNAELVLLGDRFGLTEAMGSCCSVI